MIDENMKEEQNNLAEKELAEVSGGNVNSSGCPRGRSRAYSFCVSEGCDYLVNGVCQVTHSKP